MLETPGCKKNDNKIANLETETNSKVTAIRNSWAKSFNFELRAGHQALVLLNNKGLLLCWMGGDDAGLQYQFLHNATDIPFQVSANKTTVTVSRADNYFMVTAFIF